MTAKQARQQGYYWVKAFVWSNNPVWVIAEWIDGSWWLYGDDFNDDAFVEIDNDIIIKHNEST